MRPQVIIIACVGLHDVVHVVETEAKEMVPKWMNIKQHPIRLPSGVHTDLLKKSHATRLSMWALINVRQAVVTPLGARRPGSGNNPSLVNRRWMLLRLDVSPNF